MSDSAPFATRVVAIVIGVAILGFGLFVWLGAYAPDLRSGRDGGAHALSTAATGFKGLTDLLSAAGANVRLIRDPHALDTEVTVIATPPVGLDAAQMQAFVAARGDRPTLFVLPKWATRRIDTHPAWVEQTGLLPDTAVNGTLALIAPAVIARHGDVQGVRGSKLAVLATGPGGVPLLVQVGEQRWILSDPDYLDNRALATPAGALRAAAILRRTSFTNGRAFAFDLTLNGFGAQPNLLKLALEPPFLALTLCLLVAAALAGWAAALRFGAPLPDERALAFGKQALAQNTAALLRLAKRSGRTGGRYAQLIRDAAARTGGLRETGAALDARLDNRGRGRRFTELAHAAEIARGEPALVAAARDLYRWKELENP